PFATGKATTAFEHDLVVDANGNPHLLAVVGPASTVFSPQAGYFISTGLMLMMYDFTRDEFGDWNMLHVASVSTFRASFPLTQTTVGNIITQDNHVQMSRSPDGSKIFMAWLDTDTTDANYQAISSPNDTLGTLTNIAPDLFVRAYDLNSGKMSKVKNWTGTDPTWGGSILLPKLAPLSLNGPASGQHTLPLVFANIDGATALLPTSYYYIQDIRLDEATDFTEEARFFFNCKRTPFANTLEQTAPACGQANGAISLNPAGGTPPFRFQWQAIQGDSSISLQQGPDVSGLPAGIYQLRIVDANGCADEKVVLLNDQSSPQLSLKSSSDISCFGANDGQAEIAISGGSGPYTILWSNGESAAAAQALPAGISSVRVSDSAGCSSFLSVQVDEPSPILLDLNLSHLSCHGAADGAIQVRVSGGNPPFTYAWSNGDTTALLQQAAGGEYSLLLTDANGCTQQAQALLNEPPPLAISTQVVGDNTATEPPYNGRAFVSGTGGTPFTGGGLPYRFLWCDGLEANFHPALPGGPCEVILTDANGCEIRDTVIVGGVTPVSITSPETGILALSLFPNPNKGNFELRLKLSSPQEVQLQVFDMHGRRLYNRKTPHISSLHTPISLPGLPAGVYLLRLSTSQGTASRRFVLTGR
ncbi:MAG: T9SS C-terminal target domain-containing protein, partial [Bacteroidetes bacterium]